MNKKSIHIIGGGIIGLCSAYFLHKEGVEVTVIDKGDLTDGASHGNAGMIVPSHFIPLASPGVIAQGIKWMFDSKSPFYIKPRLSLELAQWMWKFYKSCSRDKVNKAIPVLFDFNEYSKTLYRKFSMMSEFAFDYEEKGLLMLYKSLKQEAEEIEIASKARDLGLGAEILSPHELIKLEPDIKLDVRGGLYFPGDAHLYPNKFMSQMIKYLETKGVQFIPKREVIDFNSLNGNIYKLLMSNGEELIVENVLFSGGSWTGKLMQKLGVKISLQDGKGYSMTLDNPKMKPKIPTILSEAKVAITPMGEDLRIGGTLEISNFSKQINKNRLQGIMKYVPQYYPEMQIAMPENDDVWYGYRPCTPDGMPYIDQLSNISNAYIAAGHGMMGMSLGPSTGKMVSEIFTEKKTTTPRELMKVNRF